MVFKHLFVGFVVSSVVTAVAIAYANPKLRAGSKLAISILNHGMPVTDDAALMRLPHLCGVTESTCHEAGGRFGCYLAKADEEQANHEAFNALESWEQEQAQGWHAILSDNDGNLDIGTFIQDLTSLQGCGNMGMLSLEDFKGVVGAGIRSLQDQRLVTDDVLPVFQYIDSNDDGVASEAERTEYLGRLCADLAVGPEMDHCLTYAGAFAQINGGGITFGEGLPTYFGVDEATLMKADMTALAKAKGRTAK